MTTSSSPRRPRGPLAVLALVALVVGLLAGPGATAAPAAPTAPAAPVGAAAAEAPLQVQGVTATAGDGSATVSWQLPLLAVLVTSYTVTAQPGGASVTVGDPLATSAVVPGLRNGTAYTFTVAASDLLGTGPASVPSAPVVPQATPGLPPQVQGVTATPGDASARVAWTALGGEVTSYTVTASPGGSSVVVGAARAGSAPQAVVGGLTNGTAYTVTVTAAGAAGSGPASAPSAPVTPRAAPLLPVPSVTDVAATAGDRAATVTWTPPALPVGLGYRVDVVGTGVSVEVADPTASSATVEGLTNGRAYSFTVTTTRVDGATSDPAGPTAPVVPAGPPLAPTGVAAARGDGSLVVTWAPAVANGADVTAYRVRVGDQEQTVPASPRRLEVTGLRNGTAYDVTVTATNAAGTGPASAPVRATPAAPPGRVARPTATVTGRTVVLRWRAPAANGAAVTGYRVSGGPRARSVGAGTRTLRLTGLSARRYAFRVTARNAVGAGPASTPVRVRVRR